MFWRWIPVVGGVVLAALVVVMAAMEFEVFYASAPAPLRFLAGFMGWMGLVPILSWLVPWVVDRRDTKRALTQDPRPRPPRTAVQLSPNGAASTLAPPTARVLGRAMSGVVAVLVALALAYWSTTHLTLRTERHDTFLLAGSQFRVWGYALLLVLAAALYVGFGLLDWRSMAKLGASVDEASQPLTLIGFVDPQRSHLLLLPGALDAAELEYVYEVVNRQRRLYPGLLQAAGCWELGELVAGDVLSAKGITAQGNTIALSNETSTVWVRLLRNPFKNDPYADERQLWAQPDR